MFTGIIEEVGRIAAIQPHGGGRLLRVEASFAPELRVDQSVAVNGACLTVVAQDAGTFDVVAVDETLRKTTVGGLAVDTPVNLERAMKLGDRLDGHLVQGHVDGTATVSGVVTEETNRLYTLQLPEALSPYVIPVGSITLDGISLTAARVEGNAVTVAIIPHTLSNTTIERTWRPGAAVNVEVDLIGKYVARSMQARERKAPL